LNLTWLCNAKRSAYTRNNYRPTAECDAYNRLHNCLSFQVYVIF